MPTLVHRFVLTGEEREVSFARRKVVDKVRSWNVPLNDDVADSICLVASELISNAVIHGKGPVTVTVYHRPGRLVLDVVDGDPAAPRTSCAQAGDEGGRGLALVEILASRCAWEPVGQGKRVWAEIALPRAAPAMRAAVLRGALALRPKHGSVTEPESLTLDGRVRGRHTLRTTSLPDSDADSRPTRRDIDPVTREPTEYAL